MPLFSIAKFWTGLASLLVLAAAAYLLWTYSQGAWTVDGFGRRVFYRETWRLWTGGGCLCVGVFGRELVLLLLASPGRPKGRPSLTPERLTGAGDASLYVETGGPANAPVLIFTHGWGMASSFWHDAAASLGDRYRVILWDLPGLGRSTLGARGRVDLRDYAEDLAILIARYGGPNPVLVGHSIGGMVIQTLVRDHPRVAETIGGVVLLNTTFTNPLRTMAMSGLARALRPLLEIMMRLTVWLEPLVWLSNWQSYFSGGSHLAMRLGFAGRPARNDLDEVVLLGTKNRPGVQAKGNLAMFRWDATDAVSRFGKPVLVICGGSDIVTKAEAGEKIARDAPLGQLEVVARANHMGPKERARAYEQLIADFVLAVQPAARDFDRESETRAGEPVRTDVRPSPPGERLPFA